MTNINMWAQAAPWLALCLTGPPSLAYVLGRFFE
jgi:hypothetical protein